jgi:hypothetical protein
MNAAPLALKHAPDRMPAYRRGSPEDEPVRIRHRTDSSGSELTDKMPVLRHDWYCHYRERSEYSRHDIHQKYWDASARDLSDWRWSDGDVWTCLRDSFVGPRPARGHFHPNRTIDILPVLADMHRVRQSKRARPVASLSSSPCRCFAQWKHGLAESGGVSKIIIRANLVPGSSAHRQFEFYPEDFLPPRQVPALSDRR